MNKDSWKQRSRVYSEAKSEILAILPLNLQKESSQIFDEFEREQKAQQKVALILNQLELRSLSNSTPFYRKMRLTQIMCQNGRFEAMISKMLSRKISVKISQDNMNYQLLKYVRMLIKDPERQRQSPLQNLQRRLEHQVSHLG